MRSVLPWIMMLTEHGHDSLSQLQMLENQPQTPPQEVTIKPQPEEPAGQARFKRIQGL